MCMLLYIFYYQLVKLRSHLNITVIYKYYVYVVFIIIVLFVTHCIFELITCVLSFVYLSYLCACVYVVFLPTCVNRAALIIVGAYLCVYFLYFVIVITWNYLILSELLDVVSLISLVSWNRAMALCTWSHRGENDLQNFRYFYFAIFSAD